MGLAHSCPPAPRSGRSGPAARCGTRPTAITGNGHVQELGIDRSQATFVFVTSRRWPRADKENWIAGKRADGIWRDVRVIDADMLEQWLERAEAAAIWAAERAGFRPVEMLRSVEEEWAIWRSRFEPRATERLVLAGRDEQAKDSVARLTGGPCPPVTIEAHSPDEARAFAAAGILTAGDARIRCSRARSWSRNRPHDLAAFVTCAAT